MYNLFRTSILVQLYLSTYNSGSAAITNGVATVTVIGLKCGTNYTLLAGGTLNGYLVGPRSFLGITTKSCLVTMMGECTIT